MRLIDADESKNYLYDHLDDLHMIAAQNAIDEMPTIDAIPREKWNELKESIIEMRDSGGTAAQNVVCKFLTNLMEILEKEGKSDGSD